LKFAQQKERTGASTLSQLLLTHGILPQFSHNCKAFSQKRGHIASKKLSKNDLWRLLRLQKRLAEFRRHSGEKFSIGFDHDMRVGENTYQPANVGVDRLQRATPALQQAAAYSEKWHTTFPSIKKVARRRPFAVLFRYSVMIFKITRSVSRIPSAARTPTLRMVCSTSSPMMP